MRCPASVSRRSSVSWSAAGSSPRSCTVVAASAGAPSGKMPVTNGSSPDRDAVDEVLAPAVDRVVDLEDVLAVARDLVEQHRVGMEADSRRRRPARLPAGVVQRQRGLEPAGHRVGQVGDQVRALAATHQLLALARGEAEAVHVAGQDLAVEHRRQRDAHSVGGCRGYRLPVDLVAQRSTRDSRLGCRRLRTPAARRRETTSGLVRPAGRRRRSSRRPGAASASSVTVTCHHALGELPGCGWRFAADVADLLPRIVRARGSSAARRLRRAVCVALRRDAARRGLSRDSGRRAVHCRLGRAAGMLDDRGLHARARDSTTLDAPSRNWPPTDDLERRALLSAGRIDVADVRRRGAACAASAAPSSSDAIAGAASVSHVDACGSWRSCSHAHMISCSRPPVFDAFGRRRAARGRRAPAGAAAGLGVDAEQFVHAADQVARVDGPLASPPRPWRRRRRRPARP